MSVVLGIICVKVTASSFKPEIRLRKPAYKFPNAWANQMSVELLWYQIVVSCQLLHKTFTAEKLWLF